MNPPPFMRNPIPSPKNAAQNPSGGPISIPASTEKKIVSENSTVANLTVIKLATIHSAVMTPMYAICCAADFPQMIRDSKRRLYSGICFVVLIVSGIIKNLP